MVGEDTRRVAADQAWGFPLVKYRVVVLPRAKQDGREIDNYLAIRNPAAADRFAENLQATIDLQASLPTPGTPWLTENPALANLRWTRVSGFTNYLVFLRISGTVMEVVRILHASRDLEAVLGT